MVLLITIVVVRCRCFYCPARRAPDGSASTMGDSDEADLVGTASKYHEAYLRELLFDAADFINGGAIRNWSMTSPSEISVTVPVTSVHIYSAAAALEADCCGMRIICVSLAAMTFNNSFHLFRTSATTAKARCVSACVWETNMYCNAHLLFLQ